MQVQSVLLRYVLNRKNKAIELTFKGYNRHYNADPNGFNAGFETFGLKTCFDAKLFFIQLISNNL
jgi:hypothetical protein